MVTTAERGRQARQRLLQAATELIAERGWSAISTRMLAERAGVAPGVVHYHFTSVQALLSEAALQAARSLTAQAGPVLAGARSADEALTVLLAMLDGSGGTDAVSVLFVETYLAAARDEALQSALGEVIAEFRRQLADRLAAHAVPDPAATAAVLAAAVDGVILHRTLLPGPDGSTVATVLRRLLTAGSEATS
ncbi:TetR/AcrR family transcriptional regulator [Couchioplanes caeruleus]|uniref:TetR family transcriptional regulator n=2 Tax=Couchioplanes caeruleus TaxID=56438 RepID=A0A1K0GX87_9ACTN|nr:TetR/AcrR family transcriptional regulator [Couchioplanes caeruleus]OJF16028.1 TetR family transcriptional regulator [Couchioplanes caeruleus subsp. caeruleus]ROP27885.1 TetR family transcriptional regulator [Couchioplanes caeruleus]